MAAAVCYLSAALRDGVGLDIAGGRRYAFTLSIAFAILVLIAITDAVRASGTLFQRDTLAALAVGAVAALNYQNNWLYKSPSENWPRFHAFLESVVAAEKSGVAQRLTLEGEEREGWPISVNVRPRH